MAGKSNIRSMRFSDTMIEMIESQAGDSFTAKFEALVTRCMWELPRKEEELNYVQAQIRKEYARLDRIRKAAGDLESKLNSYNSNMQYYVQQSKQAVNSIDQLIKDVTQN